MQKYKLADGLYFLPRKRVRIWNYCIAPLLMLPVIVVFPYLLIAEYMERYRRWAYKQKIKFTYVRIK